MVTTLITVISRISHSQIQRFLFCCSVTRINNHHAVFPSDLTCCLIHANTHTHTHTFFFPSGRPRSSCSQQPESVLPCGFLPPLLPHWPYAPCFFCSGLCVLTSCPLVLSPCSLNRHGPQGGRDRAEVAGGHSSRNAEPLGTNAAKTKQNKVFMIRM